MKHWFYENEINKNFLFLRGRPDSTGRKAINFTPVSIVNTKLNIIVNNKLLAA